MRFPRNSRRTSPAEMDATGWIFRLVVVVGLLSAPLAQAASASEIISFESGPEIFPEDWVKPPLNGKALPIDEDNRERARTVIEKALRKYPESLTENKLKKVHLVGGLTFHDRLPYAGTASAERVYVVAGDRTDGYTDKFIEDVFHKEFSTLLLNNYLSKFDRAAWRAVNPADFRYSGSNSWDSGKGKDGGAEAIASGNASLRPLTDEESIGHGFLTAYSKSSIENDFNEYAAALFSGNPAFWEQAKQVPGIEKKARLAAGFYESLDTNLNWDYFQNLAKESEETVASE